MVVDPEPECAELVAGMDRLPGIRVIQSSSGEGTRPFCIWFEATFFSQLGLAILARCTCPRYYNKSFTKIEGTGDSDLYTTTFNIHLYHGDTTPIMYELQGPPGCFEKAKFLAEAITELYQKLTIGSWQHLLKGFEQNEL